MLPRSSLRGSSQESAQLIPKSQWHHRAVKLHPKSIPGSLPPGKDTSHSRIKPSKRPPLNHSIFVGFFPWGIIFRSCGSGKTPKDPGPCTWHWDLHPGTSTGTLHPKLGPCTPKLDTQPYPGPCTPALVPCTPTLGPYSPTRGLCTPKLHLCTHYWDAAPQHWLPALSGTLHPSSGSLPHHPRGAPRGAPSIPWFCDITREQLRLGQGGKSPGMKSWL